VHLRTTQALAAFVLIATAAVVAPSAVTVAPVEAATSFVPGSAAYQAVRPSRLADTRPDQGAFGFTRISPNIIRVQVTGIGGVPPDAVAAVLNITGVNARAAGFVTVYPAGGGVPTASNVNFDHVGQVMANMVTVKLGVGGAVDVYTSTPMDLIIDVSGAYARVDKAVAAGRLVTFADGAHRVLDTRTGNVALTRSETRTVDVASSGVPADATAVVVNLTTTEGGTGFWTAFPVGQDLPNVSNINIDIPGQTRAGQAIVLLSGGQRAFNVFSLGGGQLIVDVAGYFTGAAAAGGPSADGLFYPADPIRLLDSRQSYALPPWAGSTLEFAVGGPGQVSAVALNVTGTESMRGGFVTGFPSGVVRPNASNLNFDTFDQTVANHAIVRVSTRGASVFTSSGVQMIADLAGWYLGSPSAALAPPPVNPVFGPATAAELAAGSIGMSVPVGTGANLDAVANLGIAATWNGAAQLGVPGNIVLFGHRTTHGAPFRFIDIVPLGGIVSLAGDDGHSYNYLVVRQDVTAPSFAIINAIGTSSGPATVQLVACTPPGSVRFRVVTTARLISVT
jgi:hypothetical protein